MPRTKRRWVSQDCGSFHLISRLAGNNNFFTIEEKDYFLSLMERLAASFFIRIHSFCIMGNHFHILATGMELEAQKATTEELINRYKRIFGKEAEPPQGSYQSNGDIIPDADGGMQRLRDRLGSVSRFIQELKQTFSRWYNKKHDRKGYLWEGRFKGVIVYQGEAQLICSSYIELNPVRAGLSRLPEDYRWSSLGIRMQLPGRAEKLLCPLSLADVLKESQELPALSQVKVTVDLLNIDWYRQFVYLAGGIEREGKAHMPKQLIDQVVCLNGHLGILGRLGYRLKNFSEGIAIGSYSAIVDIQESENRKNIHPRLFLNTYWAYTTRVLRS